MRQSEIRKRVTERVSTAKQSTFIRQVLCSKISRNGLFSVSYLNFL
jgi:hypothetical protein